MEIIRQTREFSKVERYLMTLSDNVISVKDIVDGAQIEVAGVLEYVDTNSKGETVEIMSIITPTNEAYATQSATFKRNVNDMLELFDGEPFKIEKRTGVTKAGRDYVWASLVL